MLSLFRPTELISQHRTLSSNPKDLPQTKPPSLYLGPAIPPEHIHKNYRSRISRSFNHGFIQHLDLKLTDVGPGYAELRIRSSDPRFENPGGVLHGGAVLSVLDVAGGKAAYTVLPPEKMVVTSQMSSNFLKGIRSEVAVCRGQVVRSGKTVVVVKCDLYAVKGTVEHEEKWWMGDLTEEKLELCATALQTLVVVPGKEIWSQ
jgi:uncharacterized protein (TIGR00369 family)